MDEDEMDAEELEELDADGFDDEFDAKRRGGSGVRVFNLLSKRSFDYSYWMGLRIHNRDITNGTYTLQVFQTLPSRQDPQEFTAAAASMSLTCVAGDIPPALKVTTQLNLGPYFKVVLNIAQATASAKLYAELSAVLYARPA
jgi:hypothetical protein